MARSLQQKFYNMVCGQMLCPGWIASKMMLHAIKGDPERAKKILGRTPMNCFGTVADIGLATTYLLPAGRALCHGRSGAREGGASIGF
jgi:gluconate 5-dehydrogenase